MCIELELSIIVSIETSTIKTIFWFRSAVISRLNNLIYTGFDCYVFQFWNDQK